MNTRSPLPVRSHGLSAAERDRYAADGFLVRAACLDAKEIAVFADAAERAAERALAACAGGRTYVLDGRRFVDVGFRTVQFEGAPDPEAIKVVEPVCDLDADLDALRRDPRLTDPVRDVLGVEHLGLWTDKLNLKRAGGGGFGWHQDAPYWTHDRARVDDLPNVMVTLDDASADNGCFRVIRGSHRGGCLPGTDDGTQLGGFYTDPTRFDLADAVDLAVPAGSVILFDPHLVHGSGPNRAATSRRALVITYQPAGAPTLKARVRVDLPRPARAASTGV
jgi:ectoine hydroxylase-related dioxygenase (phytanoyl-CoA dioxygenase family)